VRFFTYLKEKGLLMFATAAAERRTHESSITVWLTNRRAHLIDLRKAVEYFLTGPGKNLPRPCCRCEWKHLLLTTEVRRIPIPNDDLAGEFLPC